jgi:hypothetical protein
MLDAEVNEKARRLTGEILDHGQLDGLYMLEVVQPGEDPMLRVCDK